MKVGSPWSGEGPPSSVTGVFTKGETRGEKAPRGEAGRTGGALPRPGPQEREEAGRTLPGAAGGGGLGVIVSCLSHSGSHARPPPVSAETASFRKSRDVEGS